MAKRQQALAATTGASWRRVGALPCPVACAACASDGARPWLVGGRTAPTATAALADVVWLELEDLNAAGARCRCNPPRASSRTPA